MKKYGITVLSEMFWFAISLGIVFLIFTNASLTFVFFVALTLYTVSTILYLLMEIGAQKLIYVRLQRNSK